MSLFSAQSNMFSAGAGLHRDCSLSSIRFVIFMDKILRCSRGEERVRFGDLRSSTLLLADLCFCWLYQTMTFSTHWGWFAAECEALGWESVPPSLRPWSSARKLRIAPFRLGVSCCPERRSSSMSRSCSWVIVKWSVRWTDWCSVTSNAAIAQGLVD